MRFAADRHGSARYPCISYSTQPLRRTRPPDGSRPKHVSYKWRRDSLGERDKCNGVATFLFCSPRAARLWRIQRARETQGVVHKKKCVRSPRRCLCAKTGVAICFYKQSRDAQVGMTRTTQWKELHSRGSAEEGHLHSLLFLWLLASSMFFVLNSLALGGRSLYCSLGAEMDLHALRYSCQLCARLICRSPPCQSTLIWCSLRLCGVTVHRRHLSSSSRSTLVDCPAEHSCNNHPHNTKRHMTMNTHQCFRPNPLATHRNMESTRRIRRAGNRRAAEMGTQHLLRVLAFCAAWLQVCASPFPPLWICCFARTRCSFPSNAYPHIRLGAIATALQLLLPSALLLFCSEQRAGVHRWAASTLRNCCACSPPSSYLYRYSILGPVEDDCRFIRLYRVTDC